MKVIKRDNLIKANAIAKKNKWPRYFIKNDFKKHDKDQNWPIHFAYETRSDFVRCLIEHSDGEFYQIDIEKSIYEKCGELVQGRVH